MDNSKIYIYGKEVVTPYYLNEAVANKATKAYVDESIANIEAGDVDLTNYYTKEETEAYVTEAIADVETGDVDLTNYYTKNDVDEKIEETEKWLAGKRFHFADSMDSIDNIQALVLEAKEVGWENIVLVVCGGFIESLHGLYTVTDTVLITTVEGKNSGDITFTMLHPGKGSFNTEYAAFNDKGYNETTVTEQTIILTIENDMLAGMDYPTTNEKLIAHYLPTNATSDTPAYMPTVAANPASKGYVDSLNPIIFLDGTTETTLAVDIREKIFPILKDETVVRYPMFYVYPNDSEFNVGVTKIENVADDHFVLKSIDENMRVERAASNSWIIPSTTYLWVDHDYTNVRDIRKQTGQNGGPALVLETGTEYTEPYEPQYDGSPATKKYVDKLAPIYWNEAYNDESSYDFWTNIVNDFANTGQLPNIFRKKNSYIYKLTNLEADGTNRYRAIFSYENTQLIFTNGIMRPAQQGLYIQIILTDGVVTTLYENTSSWSSAVLYDNNKKSSTVLAIDNTTEYAPSGDYNPATKKYVDDAIADIDLTDYYTKSETETYVNNTVASAIGDISSFSLMPVDVLPEVDIQTNVIYLVPSENPEETNVRNEYVYINDAWEMVGTTAIDLSNYYTKEEVNAKVDSDSILTFNYTRETTATSEDLIAFFTTVIERYNATGMIPEVRIIHFSYPRTPFRITGWEVNSDTSFYKYDFNLWAFDMQDNVYTSPEYMYIIGGIKMTEDLSAISYVQFQSIEIDAMVRTFTTLDQTNGVRNLVLTTANTATYTPTANYHPSTKKYVDDAITTAVEVLPTKDYVDGKVETAIQGLTGEELDSSLNNGQLNVGDSITCTQDYLGKYEQGNIYLVQEKERGEVSIVQQLQDLGFNVSISSRLLSNDIKYFYIVEYGDEGDMYCAYSKVPLNVSGSKFPSDGWKTFSVRKMNDSDPNFYYAQWDTNKNLSSMRELTSSTNDGKYWASQFSSSVVATYTNDPAAASLYTPYVVDPTELVKYTINITPKTDLSNYILKTEVEANYYSKEEIDAKFAEIMTILPVASQEEVQEILSGEVSE